MLKQQVTYSLKCDKCKYEVIIIPQLDMSLMQAIRNQGFVVKLSTTGQETHLCPQCKGIQKGH